MLFRCLALPLETVMREREIVLIHTKPAQYDNSDTERLRTPICFIHFRQGTSHKGGGPGDFGLGSRAAREQFSLPP